MVDPVNPPGPFMLELSQVNLRLISTDDGDVDDVSPVDVEDVSCFWKVLPQKNHGPCLVYWRNKCLGHKQIYIYINHNSMDLW